MPASGGSGGTSGGTSSTSGNASSQTPQYGGTLNYLVSGLLSEWDLGLDPATGGAAPSIYEDAIFGQLFRLTPSGGIEPVLATGYTVTEGGTLLTITLHSGVKFSDGTPLNAAAVESNVVCSQNCCWPLTRSPTWKAAAPPCASTWTSSASRSSSTTPASKPPATAF